MNCTQAMMMGNNRRDNTVVIRNTLFREGENLLRRHAKANADIKKSPDDEKAKQALLVVAGEMKMYFMLRQSIAPYVASDVLTQRMEGQYKKILRDYAPQ